MFSKLKGLFSSAPQQPEPPPPLDYDKAVVLDAEDLAEQGIAEAYAKLVPALRSYIPEPLEIEELLDEEKCSYSIRWNGVEHLVYSPDVEGSEAAGWGRATAVFFQLVNEQLSSTPVRFYAIYGGNDLGGMFLTEREAENAKALLPRRQDWPYFPTMEEPWHGQFH